MSPLAAKRWRSFRRIRRAWWSLLALCALFLFCMCADWVCPYDPNAVVDLATLEKYREPRVETTYDVRSARFRLADGKVADFEGPSDVKAAVDYTGAKYLIKLDNGATFKKGTWLTRYTEKKHKAWSGVDAVNDKTPGFTVVLSKGDMRLYEIG